MERYTRTALYAGCRVDKVTGEIYGVFETSDTISEGHPLAKEATSKASAKDSFEAYASAMRSSEDIQREYEIIQASEARIREAALKEAQGASEAVGAEEPKKKKAGRKPKVFTNPIAHLMVYLVEDKPEWLDNIIWGSCFTSGGVSGGKMNVRAGNVVSALYLREITAKACQFEGDSERKARLVAQAARHAAHGIALYLIGNPDLLKQLEARAAIDAHLKSMTDMEIKITTVVQDWYDANIKGQEKLGDDCSEVAPIKVMTFEEYWAQTKKTILGAEDDLYDIQGSLNDAELTYIQ